MILDSLYSAWNTNRDNDSLYDLIPAVRDHVKRYNCRLGDEAEDVAQDIAILVLGKLPEFKPATEASFSHWIAAIMRRKRLSGYRDHKHISSEALPEPEPATEHYQDISELPPGIKEAASYILQGYSIEQSAALMKLKPGTLRKRLHAYRKKVTK